MTAQSARRGSVLDATAKVVCASCNNGWMNQLEEDVRTYLPKMIKGNPVKLTKARQQALATWSAKTAMMYQCAHRKADQVAIPRDDYTALFQEKQPSNIMRVWTATMTPPVLSFGRVPEPGGVPVHPPQR